MELKLSLKLGLPALTLVTFFLLLGNRPLNEPDEGRYTEVAREMIETGDWIVPHFWYLPHLDKPPLTYWLIALSMNAFGQNEWAARLPAALAGVSGVWGVFLMGCAVGGRRVGLWSALLLQTSFLYFLMSRMLTTDIFLAQFMAWAIYFFWRSWAALTGERRIKPFLAWHLAAWAAIAFGFLTKGPIALAMPVAGLAALLIFRRTTLPRFIWTGIIAGFVLFLLIAAPWFLVVFHRMPHSAHYMILGQAAGHLLGTTIKNRRGFPGYFFVILAGGLLPWTLLPGWLWRRGHWRDLRPQSKEAWLLLNACALFTFTLFSLSHAKLPAYILPIFPPLAILLAWRFFSSEIDAETAPKAVWRIGLVAPLIFPAGFPLLVLFLLHQSLPWWMKLQTPLALALLISIFTASRRLKPAAIAALSVGMALLGFFSTLAEFPLFQFNFKDNQPLDQIGLALRENSRAGDTIVCWGNDLPQGLPFYAGGLISAAHRPYLGRMDLKKVPFEFPGNRERLGGFYLPDAGSLADLLRRNQNMAIVGFAGSVEDFRKSHPDLPLRVVAVSGKWTLYLK